MDNEVLFSEGPKADNATPQKAGLWALLDFDELLNLLEEEQTGGAGEDNHLEPTLPEKK